MSNVVQTTSAAPVTGIVGVPWQPSVLDSRRVRLSGAGTPEVRLGATCNGTHHNSTVPTTGAMAVKTAGALGAAKQAAPPRGVPR